MVTRNIMNPGRGRMAQPKAQVLNKSVGGTDRGGFELAIDKIEGVVYMKLWGVWHLDVAHEFHAGVTGAGGQFKGREWGIIADSSRFGAQSQEVARLRGETMAAARSLGCGKIASIGSSVVHAMQFKRISEESHVGSGVFADEKSALEWVHEQRRK
jgi:hypothetical protein